jgi:hypothetical protein
MGLGCGTGGSGMDGSGRGAGCGLGGSGMGGSGKGVGSGGVKINCLLATSVFMQKLTL